MLRPEANAGCAETTAYLILRLIPRRSRYVIKQVAGGVVVDDPANGGDARRVNLIFAKYEIVLVKASRSKHIAKHTNGREAKERHVENING
jgi:hypothetical protein